MGSHTPPILTLAESVDGQETDWFLFLARKEEHKTREGKPYFRISFRDASREVTVPVWHDSPWHDACRFEWQAGEFYKVRGTLRDSHFGPQLEIRRIRPVTDADRADGYDPLSLLPGTRFDVATMYAELLELARQHIRHAGLRDLVMEIFTADRERICELPAAPWHHHAFRGGFLEHLLSVARNAVFLAEKYGALYPRFLPPSQADLVIAGAMLHDIGKLRELRSTPAGAELTSAGELVGHSLLGRDMVRELASKHNLEPDLQLRLEHILVSHQRTPEWGAARPPMTPEALLVFYADDIDARFQMMIEALEQDVGAGLVTTTRNALQQKVYRGPAAESDQS